MNAVDTLVERLHGQIANADADISDALLDAQTTGEPIDPDDWHVEVPVGWLREAVARIAALEAENGELRVKVEQAAEDERDRLYAQTMTAFNHSGYDERFRTTGLVLGDWGAMLPSARAALRQAEEKSDG